MTELIRQIEESLAESSDLKYKDRIQEMLRRLRLTFNKGKVPNPNTLPLRKNAENLIKELRTAHILPLLSLAQALH